MNKGYLLGRQVLPRVLAAELYRHGWKDPVNQWTMLAIILAESDGREDAINFNLATLESLSAGQSVITWDPLGLPVPPLGAAFDYATLPARQLCVIVSPELGKLRSVLNDQPVQMPSSGLVVTSFDVGLVQRNLAVTEYRTEREAGLRTLEANLHAGRVLYLQSKFKPWAASIDRALNPKDPGRHAHRAARGIGNWLAEQGSLAPLPLLDFRAG